MPCGSGSKRKTHLSGGRTKGLRGHCFPLFGVASRGRSATRLLPFAPPPLSRQDTLEIIFTSGTTAEPRGVVISHGNVLANIEPLEKEMQKYLRYEKLVHPLRFLNLLPLRADAKITFLPQSFLDH